MKKLKIKFAMEYGIDTDNSDGEPCHCCMTLSLPEDSNGELVSILRDSTTMLFGETLSSRWGNWDDRTQTVTITSANWDKLHRLVDSRIDEAVQILKEVKEKNECLLNTVPKNGTVVIEI